MQKRVMNHRLGILTSHPIQYYAPWFRHLAQRMDINVFYAHRQNGAGQAAAGFGVEFDWDIPLLEGYPYRWLANVARHPTIRTFNGLDTPELYDIVRKDRFDAFLIFGWNRKSCWQAVRACRKEQIPVLMRGDSHLGTTRSLAKTAIKYLPYRWLLPEIDAHLYVGKRNKDYLRHYGVREERLFFAPHFVDTDFFAGGAQQAKTSGKAAKLREEFGIPDDAFVFLFVGKLITKKRPFDFVSACQKVLASQGVPDIHGLIVGDGALRESLEARARPQGDRIHFAGFRNQTQMPELYQLANALVLPSDGDETWGLVVNEAAACGIPAVVSDVVGCAPDLIDEGRTGYTFLVADVNRLAQQLVAMKSLCERAPQMVNRSLAEKAERYSMNIATEGLRSALQHVTRPRVARAAVD